MYELTFAVANATGANVFAVFEQDAEIVINVINHLIARNENEKKENEQEKQIALPKKDFWDYV